MALKDTLYSPNNQEGGGKHEYDEKYGACKVDPVWSSRADKYSVWDEKKMRWIGVRAN